MALLTSVYASNYALYAAAASQRGTSGHHPGFLPMGAMHFPFLSSEYGIPLPPYPLTTGMAAAARMDSASPDSIPTNLKITTTTTATSSSPSSSSSSPTTPSKNSENSRKNSLTSNRSDTSPKLSFSIEGILGRPDPRCPRLSLSSPGRTLDSHLVGVVDTQNPYLGQVGDPDSPRSDTYEDADGSGRFSWLQCTRYKPPKLPRVKRKDGVKKRKLGRNPRVPFTQHQVNTLEQKFRRTHYLSSVDVAELSAALNLTETRVKIWFQNRRARERRDRENQKTHTATSGNNGNNNGGVNSNSSSNGNSNGAAPRLPTSLSSSSSSSSVALPWSGPVPPTPSALAHFSQALQHGASAFTPVAFSPSSHPAVTSFKQEHHSRSTSQSPGETENS